MAFDDYLEELLARNESDDLEFKTAKGGLPSSLWDTYSAFANTDGGTIVLGVKEEEGRYEPDGLDIKTIEKYKRDFWNKVNNRDVVCVNLLKNDDVKVCEHEGRYFMLINVPRALREQMPVYHGRSPYGNTHKRDNEGDYRCTDAEVRRMFADSDLTESPDMRILTGFTWEDIDMESLSQFRQLMSVSKPNHPWLALDNRQFMHQLGGYRKDKKTQKEGFTLAGMLMFGKWTSITDPQCCPHYMVDYREIPEDTTTIRWVDRIWPDGTWEANLFQFYRRVLPKLQSCIPQSFHIEDNTRIDNNLGKEAIRESFVNLCVHATYSTENALVILKKKQEIVFTNPGTMLVSKKQYYAGGDSVCRNPSLQKMFTMLGHAEKAGSGVAKILQGWESLNWRNPFVEEQHKPDKVVLTLPLESLLNDTIKERLTQTFGEKRLQTLNHNELLTLASAAESEEITNERLRDQIDLHRADITAMLKKLCHNHYLISMGTGRGTRYKLPKIYDIESDIEKFTGLCEAITEQEKAEVTTINRKDATSEYENTKNHRTKQYPKNKKVATIDNKAATIDKKETTSDKKVATLENESTENLPTNKHTKDRKVATSDKKVATIENESTENLPTNKHTKDRKVATSDKKVATIENESTENLPTNKHTKDKKIATSESESTENLPTNKHTKDRKVATSDKKVATLDKKVATLENESTENLPTNKHPRDKKVATTEAKVATTDNKNATNKAESKVKQEVLVNEIKVYCSTWKSMTEIATHVGKSQDYMRNKIITKMVAEGLLVLQHPEKKNHPKQKYRTK